jgi:hypothetical protein
LQIFQTEFWLDVVRVAREPGVWLPLLLCALLSSCCRREIVARHPSPSEAHVLSILRVNCAAFDSFHTDVRLGRGDPLRGEIAATISSSPEVQVTWADDTSVFVFVPLGYHINVKKKVVDGVRIDFR